MDEHSAPPGKPLRQHAKGDLVPGFCQALSRRLAEAENASIDTRVIASFHRRVDALTGRLADFYTRIFSRQVSKVASSFSTFLARGDL